MAVLASMWGKSDFGCIFLVYRNINEYKIFANFSLILIIVFNMIFKTLFYTIYLCIFSFWGLFQCFASIDMFHDTHWHHDEAVYHTDHTTTHDCCPEDGHQKEILEKKLSHALKNIHWVDESSRFLWIRFLLVVQIHDKKIIPTYHWPYFDRQRRFFTDTVRLTI